MKTAKHPLYCPHCQQPMRAFSHRGVALELCSVCGGGLLGPTGLADLLRERSDPSSWEAAGVATHLAESALACPAHDPPLAMQVYRLAHDNVDVEVDVCTGCGSVWLDASEGQVVETIADSLHDAQMAAAHERARTLSEPQAADALLRAHTEAQRADDVLVAHMKGRRRAPWPATFIMLAVFLAITAYGYLIPVQDYIASWAFVPAEFSRGERMYSLITSAFAHAHVLHLIMNSLWFVVLGKRIESYLGSLFVSALFLCSAIAGNLAFFAEDPTSLVHSVGASGGIAGLFGALVVIAPQIGWAVTRQQHAKLKWALLLWLVSQVAMAWVGPAEVNYLAHIGGFLGGAAFAGTLRLLGLTTVTELSSSPPGGRPLSIAGRMGDMIIAHPLLSIPLTGVLCMGIYALLIGVMAMDRPGSLRNDPLENMEWMISFDAGAEVYAQRRAVQQEVDGWGERYEKRAPANYNGRPIHHYVVLDPETQFVLSVVHQQEVLTARCIGQARGETMVLEVESTALLTAEDRRILLQADYEQYVNTRGETIFDRYEVSFEEGIDHVGCPQQAYEQVSPR